MPVELRKRKAPVAPPAPAPVPKKKTASKSKKAAAAKPKDEVKKADPEVEKPAKEEAEKSAPETAPEEKVEEKEKPKEDKKEDKKAAASGKVAVGDTITLEDFGGEIQTNDGEKTTLKKLVDESGSGVVLFTYPKASTPGCKSAQYSFALQSRPLDSTIPVTFWHDFYQSCHIPTY